MTNEELTIVLKNYCEKANAAGNLSFADALDLISHSQNEKNRVEDCVSWFCETRDEIVKTKSGKEKTNKLYPHAKVVGTRLYNAQVVKTYADAYAVALDAKENDTSEDYAQFHNGVADILVKYFDNLYFDYLTERYGDDFIAACKDYEDSKRIEEDKAATAKELRSAKQSLSRLKKGGDAGKIAEAEKHLAEVEAKAKKMGLAE